MNCQYCGKKIGIIENWRYGRFCSKEHQDEFREEASRLAASVLGARPANAGAGAEERAPAYSQLSQLHQLNQQSQEQSPGGEGGVEAEPPRMEAVSQQEPAPAAWKRKPVEVKAEGGNRASNERHQKMLRILAANDRTAPPVLEKDRRRKLSIEGRPYRFGEVEAPGARSVLVPPSGVVQKRPKLQFWEKLLPIDQMEEIRGALTEFECHWDGAGEWAWAAAGPGEYDFGDYLEDYSPEQPWEQWDWDALLVEAKYAQAMNEERDRRREQMRTQQASPAQTVAAAPAARGRGQAAVPAMPGYPGRMPAAQSTEAGRRAMPGLNLAPGGMTAGAGAGPAWTVGRPGPGGQSGGMQVTGGVQGGGMALPAMPAYPGRMVLRPAGGGGSTEARLGGGRAAAGGPGPLVRIVPAMGMDPVAMEWVELAPPLFLALCKIDDPAAERPALEFKTVKAAAVEAGRGREAEAPGFGGAVSPVGMRGIWDELEPSAMPAPLAPTAFEMKDVRDGAVRPERGPAVPVRPGKRGDFQIPPVAASEGGFINLRAPGRPERPDPAMNIDEYRRQAG